MRKLCCLIAVLSALSLPAWAQDAPKAEEPEVTVVVTAERTPQPVSESISSATVITAKDIREQGAQTVADVMRLVPGLTLRQSGQPGAAAKVKIRGTDSEQTLVLVDGQRVTSSAFIDGMDLSKFPVTDVSRIEVIRGPVSSLYGSEAIGGVINIITKQSAGSGGDATLSFGDNGRTERTLSLRSGDSPVKWHLTGSLPEYSGECPNSDYSATNLSARITLPTIKGWQVSLRGEDYHDSLGLPGVEASPSPNDHQWWDRTTMDLSAVRDMGNGQLECRINTADQKRRQINPDWALDSDITGKTDAGEITYRSGEGTHQWVAGMEYRKENYNDIEGGVAVRDKDIINRGLFVQDRISIGPKIGLVLGARLDDHSTAGNRLTPRMGVSYALAPKMHLRASYGEAFRAPSLVELYYNGTYGTGNPDLRPEKSKQLEAGVSLERGDDAFDIAVFTNKVRDQIDWVVVNPLTWEGTYENISRASQRGIEFSWERRFVRSTSLGLSYTYLDARNLTNDTRLLGVPHNQIAMTLAGPIRSWNAALTGRWSDDKPDYGDTVAKGCAVFDLALTRRSAKPTNPYVIIRNLTDADYQEVAGYPAEGLSMEVGMRSSW